MIETSAPPATQAGSTPGIRRTEDIAPVDRDEAAQIAAFELDQVLKLLVQLDDADWSQPTDCTDWNVRDMTAHLAGGCAGWANLKDFLRQTVLNPHILKTDVPVDAINRRELEDRAGQTPAQLIAELHAVGPKAVRNRRNLPGLLRRLHIPAKPMPGTMSMAYLTDVIYPRDQWMHRMDICRATGKPWTSNPDHDLRLLDLIIRDMAQQMAGRYPVALHITGPLQAQYHFGAGAPRTTITIDLFTLNRRASGRITAEEAAQAAQINGDEALAHEFLHHCEVLY